MGKTYKQMLKENESLVGFVKHAADLKDRVDKLEKVESDRRFNAVISANEGCPEGHKNVNGSCVKTTPVR